MSSYKFQTKEIIGQMVTKGTIGAGRLRYYQLLEKVYKDDWIGDLQEATASGIYVDHMLGPGVQLINCAEIRSVDCFAFCFSEGDFTALREVMTRDRESSPGYDACVEIAKDDFIDQVIHHGTIGGVPVSQLYEVVPKPVNYAAIREYRLDQGETLPNGDPFLKASKYSAQREVRMTFMPRPGTKMSGDRIIVQIPAPEDVFREVPTGYKPTRTYSASQELDRDTTLRQMRQTIAKIFDAQLEITIDPRRATDAEWEQDRQTFTARWEKLNRELGPYSDVLLKLYWGLRPELGDDTADLDDLFINNMGTTGIATGLHHFLREHFPEYD